MIKTLNMTDFGIYSNMIYNFSNGVNLITGGNHRGKSTIRQAIRTCLTGRPDKKDLSEVVRLAKDAKAKVGMVVDFGGKTLTIDRWILPNKLKLNGESIPLGKSLDKDGLHDHGFRRNSLAALCDAAHFFELSPEEQNTLLMAYFTGDAEIDVTKYGISAEDADQFAGLKNTNIKTFSDRFYDIRKTINKSIEKAKAEIEIINKRQAEAQKIDIDLITSEAAALKHKIEAPGIPAPQRPAALLEIEQKIVIEQDARYKSEIESKVSAMLAEGLALKEKLTAYQAHAGKCPLSGGKIECKEPALAEMMAKIAKDRADLLNQYKALKAEDEKAFAAFEKAKAEKIAALKDSRESMLAEYEGARRKIDAQNAEQAKEKDHLRDRLVALRVQIAEVDALEEEKKTAQALAASLMTSENESARMTRFINFLEKDLKEKIVGDNAGGLFEKVNKVSKMFGFDIIAEGGDLAKIKINGRTPGMLSTSERILCGISLQLAIAEMSGYNFIVCDDLESLERSYFESLVTVLNKSFRRITSILIGLNIADPGHTANLFQI